MNKIKYANLGIKIKLKRYFKGDEIYNFEELIGNFSKKYNVTKPIVKDIDLDFDYLNIVVGSQEYDIKTYVLALDYFNSNLIIARRIDKKRYDVLEIYDNTPFILRSGYENLKDDVKIEKIYTKHEKEVYEYSINGISYAEYMYFYSNPNLECKIKLRFIKSIMFQDNMFMKVLFEAKDINNINDLYKKVIEFTGNRELDLEITNESNYEFPEKIVIKKGKLVEYQKNIISDGEEKYIDYHNDMLFVTRKEDPNNNEVIKDFKKIMYKNKGVI